MQDIPNPTPSTARDAAESAGERRGIQSIEVGGSLAGGLGFGTISIRAHAHAIGRAAIDGGWLAEGRQRGLLESGDHGISICRRGVGTEIDCELACRGLRRLHAGSGGGIGA